MKKRELSLEFTREIIICSFSSWSDRVHEDTADAVSILVESDSEVTLLTPRVTPRVSDDKVIFTFLRTITDGGDGVILLVTTFLGINDTFVIELESIAFSIDTNASWLNGDGGLKLRNTLLWNLMVAFDTNFAHVFGCLTFFVVFSFIWIVLLERDLILLSVLESPHFKATIATLVFRSRVIAINKVLLGKLEKLSLLNSM